jgi:hypothetical protein
MEIFRSEFARNFSAYFLALIGFAAVAFGGHAHFDKMIDLGVTFATASLVAFQSKKSPDGNTTTTQVTVPPPSVAEPIVPKS